MIPAHPEFPPCPESRLAPPRVPPPPPPATRPKANDADTPTLPPRHATPQEIPPNGSTPFSPGLTPPAASSPPAVSPVPGPLPAPLGGAPSARAFHSRLSARAFPPAPFRSRLSTRAFPLAPFHPRLFAQNYARLLSCVVDYTCASRSVSCLPQPPHTTTRWVPVARTIQ
jgi:hypothetical protein